MARSENSYPGLRIRLRSQSPMVTFTAHELQDGNSRTWDLPELALPDDLKTEAVWRRALESWGERKSVLLEVGALLGSALLDQRAKDHLEFLASRGEEKLWRIEIQAHGKMYSWPWETLQTEALGPLSIHRSFTLVRGTPRGPQDNPTPQLDVDLVAVQLENNDFWPGLGSARELEGIRSEVERSDSRHVLSVRSDPLGTWEDLVDLYEREGVPHVFHFAGHGLERGAGLVFRGPSGEARVVSADEIAALLSCRGPWNQRCRLVFLNACSAAGHGAGPYQPFGSLAQQLTQRGIPMVLSYLGPVEDRSAVHLATDFYRLVAQGISVDHALQEARRQAFLRGNGVAWALATLQTSLAPCPLVQTSRAPAVRASASIYEFAHETQRNRLRRFLKRNRPLVVIIHGELGSGHDHVAQRVQHDLELEGRTLWRPVSTMHWFVAGEPMLSELQLLAGIARSLSLDDSGASEDLKSRVGRVLAERCASDRAVVIDLVEVVTLEDSSQAEALLQLVQELWVDLVGRAQREARNLSIFLLLRVGYLPNRLVNHRQDRDIRSQRRRAKSAVEKLAMQPRLPARVRVEVLDELRPIEEDEVSDFLEDVLELEAPRARLKARHLVGMADNETIIRRMRQLLAEWEIV